MIKKEIKTMPIEGNCMARVQSMTTAKNKGSYALAGYVLSFPEDILNLTISQLASKTKTSIATVSRFCTKLGYKNYREFQIDLSASLSKNISLLSDRFYSGDSPSTIVKKVFEMNRRSITDTEGLTRIPCLVTAAKKAIDSKRVFFVGAGGSGYVAHLASLRFSSLGINASALIDPYEGLIRFASITSSDMVVGISHSGRSIPVINLIRIAKNKKAFIVGITNYTDSVLAKLSDLNFFTSFRERRVNAAISSTAVSQLCILDALYFIIGRYQGTKLKDAILEIETDAGKYLRI